MGGAKRTASPIAVSALLLGFVLAASDAGARPSLVRDVDIVNPCKNPGQRDTRCARALDRTVAALGERDRNPASGKRFRVLQLGDSHIAADYITGTIRDRLQEKFGDGGRGFTPADQRWKLGGRRLGGGAAGWDRLRIVDRPELGGAFGFSGSALVSKRSGARSTYVVLEGETQAIVFFEKHPDGPELEVRVNGEKVAELDTRGTPAETVARPVALPAKKKGKSERRLQLVARGKGARIYGLSFEKATPGVFWDSIGPVGADAKVYLQLDQDSMKAALRALEPDLVVLMVGGNDAMKIRKRWTDLERVRRDHEQLVDALREAVPGVECLIWAPMDAGEKKGRKVVGKGMIAEVRELQEEVAVAKGCGFWDLLQVMGGPGSITAWSARGLMNADLVHPRKRAAELLGDAFTRAFLRLDEQGGR